jgi:RND family efflux transporter MFP subunit
MSVNRAFWLLLVLAPLAGCKPEAETAGLDATIRPVLSVKAEVRDSQRYGPFAGSIQPRYSTDVSFRVFGRMVARRVNVGSIIAQGEELASLDPAVQALLVRDQKAAVAGARAQLANAAAEEARQRPLFERNITPQAQFDLIVQNRETAAANLLRAESALRRAEDALSFTQLHADFAGVVTAVHLDPGQVVNAGQKIVTIAGPEVREAVIAVPSGLADQLAAGESFDMLVDLDGTVKLKAAAVHSVDPTADLVTRTRIAYLTLQDPPDAFRLGITIAVTMTRSVAPRVDLPATALLEKDGKTQVWIVDPASSKVALRDVTLLGRDQGSIAVRSGIAAGERVVTVGVHSLKEGELVKLAADGQGSAR